MTVDELIFLNSNFGNKKLEDALCKTSDFLGGENIEVSRILNLGCGSTGYSKEEGWGKTYEPHVCRSLHTLANKGLTIVGVDKHSNTAEDFESHQIDLIQSPGDLIKQTQIRFEVVLNENFSDPANPCPGLESALREGGVPLEQFNINLERVACEVMHEGALYILFGGNITLKRKVNGELILVKQIIAT